MKVALLTPTYEMDGGVAIHVRRSAKALREAGHEVLVVAADAPPPSEGFSWPGLGTAPMDTGDAASLASRLASLEFAIVHFHNLDEPALTTEVGRTAATVVSAHGWSGCPSGLRFFGSGRECLRAQGPLCIPNMLVRNCNHRVDPRPTMAYYRDASRRLAALRAADLAVVYSDAVARHLADNGIAPTVAVPLLVDFPVETPPSSEAHRVVVVGRLTPAKGVSVLLRSADQFDAEIEICGDGPARPRLERLAHRLSLAPRATFRGWLPAEEINKAYAGARVVIVPSLYPEPFGMVGPEAMAHGRPVVASRTGGTGDWLHDGVNGLAVAPGDPVALGSAIAALLADPRRAAAMGAAGRRRVGVHYSAPAHVDAILRAYRCALDAAKERRPRQGGD